MKRQIFIANWKMHKTGAQVEEYIHALLPLVQASKASILIAAPFTALTAAVAASKGTSIQIGAQNMHDEVEGAFTGEISSVMLKSAGASFVILGHSERRQLFHESNAFINRKVKRALMEGLTPVLCVGETLKEKEEGRGKEIIMQQLQSGLEDVTNCAQLMIAYEPVWAIGTGRAADLKSIEQVHSMCRSFLQEHMTCKNFSILYGGSVKAEVWKELISSPQIDGALVGGASLDPKSFAELINIVPG